MLHCKARVDPAEFENALKRIVEAATKLKLSLPDKEYEQMLKYVAIASLLPAISMACATSQE